MRDEKIKPLFISLAAGMLLALFVPTNGQTTSPNQTGAQTPQNSVPAQPPQAQNLPAELNFTPQQQEQWRQINREFRVQEVGAAAKVRDARLALNDAIESPNHNEDLIKQRARELADAQSAVTQLQALRQSRVLQLLTPDQRIKLKQIREERARDFRRGQQQTNALGQRERLRRNPNATLMTPAQRKALRQQQQKQNQKP